MPNQICDNPSCRQSEDERFDAVYPNHGSCRNEVRLPLFVNRFAGLFIPIPPPGIPLTEEIPANMRVPYLLYIKSQQNATAERRTVDQYLSEAKGEKVTVLSDILNGKIDVTKKTNEVAMAALTAFTTQLGFEAIGADKLFATKSELISDLNQYLLHNGQTAQNLVVYLNRLAMRSKTGYTGKVDDGWYFYNVNKSPTTTATKLINKATTDLVNATAVEIRKPVVQKAGDTVQTIVEKVGTRIETNVKKVQDQIKNSIGQAIKSIAQKAIDSVKTSIVNFFKGLFA